LFIKQSSLETHIKKERSSEMSRTKALISILTILILIALSGASVWAAPGGDEPAVEPTTEPTEEPTAEPTEEPTAEPTEEPTAEPIEEPPEEEPTTEHPVASALAKYFADTLGLDYDAVMGYHEEDGMGFGVIAQACWISFLANNDDGLLDQIIKAKKGEIEFSSITLPDGTTAKNWGQFKKAALGSKKAKKNLGAIMSGRANHEQEQEQEGSATGLSDKGKDKGGKPDTPPGQLKNKKDKDKGGGPPAEPPGQLKNKDKGGD
jgi:hypothetical protein